MMDMQKLHNLEDIKLPSKTRPPLSIVHRLLTPKSSQILDILSPWERPSIVCLGMFSKTVQAPE